MPENLLTLSQVEEIRKQAERATPGTWSFDSYNTVWSGSAQTKDLLEIFSIPDEPETGESPAPSRDDWYPQSSANAGFAAASRTNVPALCELVKVLADALSIECSSHNVRATDSRDADIKPLCKCPRCALLRQLKEERAALCELTKMLADALDEVHGGDGQSEPETCKCGLYLDMCPKAALLRQLKEEAL